MPPPPGLISSNLQDFVESLHSPRFVWHLIQELEIQACPLVTNGGLLDLTSRCHHLNHLDVQVKRVTKSKSVLFLKIISPGLSYGVCSWSGCRGVHSPFGNSGEFSNICQITWAENFGRQACLLCLFFPTLKQLCVWRNWIGVSRPIVASHNWPSHSKTPAQPSSWSETKRYPPIMAALFPWDNFAVLGLVGLSTRGRHLFEAGCRVLPSGNPRPQPLS